MTYRRPTLAALKAKDVTIRNLIERLDEPYKSQYEKARRRLRRQIQMRERLSLRQ